jgi:hypothetical protein
MAIITISDSDKESTLRFDSISKIFIFNDGKGNEVVSSEAKARLMVEYFEED